MDNNLILSDDHKTKLKELVYKMGVDGESDEAIKYVIDGYKTKYSVKKKDISGVPYIGGSEALQPDSDTKPFPLGEEGVVLADKPEAETAEPEKELVTPKLPKGKSPILEVAGKKGYFNFDVPPEEGGTPGKRYLFETEDGGRWYYQLEKDYQGGRWEDAHHAEADFKRYKELHKSDPIKTKQKFKDMWGDSEIANKLYDAVDKDLSFDQMKDSIKDQDTWRQISEGEPGSQEGIIEPQQEFQVYTPDDIKKITDEVAAMEEEANKPPEYFLEAENSKAVVELAQKKQDAADMIQAHSLEGQSIYNDLKEIVGDTPFEYFTNLKIKQHIKETLMKKYGNFSERAIDEVLNSYEATNKAEVFYERGNKDLRINAEALYKTMEDEGAESVLNATPLEKEQRIQGIMDRKVSKGIDKSIPEIFDEDEQKKSDLIKNRREALKSGDPDKVDKNTEAWIKAGFQEADIDGWLNLETGYRNKGKLASEVDQQVNAAIEEYRKTPQDQLKGILKKTFITWKGLEKERDNAIDTRKSILESKQNPDQDWDQINEALDKVNGRFDALSGSAENRGEINAAKHQYEAAARAYFLNRDPEEYAGSSFTDFMKSVAKGFNVEIVRFGGGQRMAEKAIGATESDLQAGLKETTTQNEFKLSDKESEALEPTKAEMIAPVAGSIGAVMTYFAAAGLVEGAVGVSKGLQLLSEGGKVKRMVGFGAKMLVEDIKFQTMFHADPGEGAMFTASMAGIGKVIPFLKQIQGEKWYKQWAKEVAKTDISLTGASNINKLVSSTKETLLNDKEFQYELEKNFGANRSEVFDNLMIEFITNPIFAAQGIITKATVGRKEALRTAKKLEGEMNDLGMTQEANEMKRQYNEIKNDPLSITFDKVYEQSTRTALARPLRKLHKDLQDKGHNELADKVIGVMEAMNKAPLKDLKHEVKKAVKVLQSEYELAERTTVERNLDISDAIEVMDGKLPIEDIAPNVRGRVTNVIDQLTEKLQPGDKKALSEIKTAEGKIAYINKVFGKEIDPLKQKVKEVKPEVKEVKPKDEEVKTEKPKEPTKPKVDPKLDKEGLLWSIKDWQKKSLESPEKASFYAELIKDAERLLAELRNEEVKKPEIEIETELLSKIVKKRDERIFKEFGKEVFDDVYEGPSIELKSLNKDGQNKKETTIKKLNDKGISLKDVIKEKLKERNTNKGIQNETNLILEGVDSNGETISIGNIKINQNNEVTRIDVEEDFMGMGISNLLYDLAIKEFGTIISGTGHLQEPIATIKSYKYFEKNIEGNQNSKEVKKVKVKEEKPIESKVGKVVISKETTNEDKKGESFAEITVFNEDGKEIPFNNFTISINGNNAHVINVNKKFGKDDPNKGVGKQAYIKLAEELGKRGIVLNSFSSRGEGGNKLWNSLFLDGLAEKDGVNYKMYSEAYPKSKPDQEIPKVPKADIEKKSIYKSKTGKYHMLREGNMVKVVDSDGNVVSKNTEKYVLKEYREEHDFDEGETSTATMEKKGVQPSLKDGAANLIVEHSTNPSEVLAELSRQPTYIPEEEIDHQDIVIGESLGKIDRSDFYRNYDKNLRGDNPGIEKIYLRGSGKRETLDQVVQDVMDVHGIELDRQDIIDFMIRFPYGTDKIYEQQNPNYRNLHNKFIELTGITATPTLIKRYADAAPLSKQQKQEADLRDQEYEALKDIELSEQEIDDFTSKQLEDLINEQKILDDEKKKMDSAGKGKPGGEGDGVIDKDKDVPPGSEKEVSGEDKPKPPIKERTAEEAKAELKILKQDLGKAQRKYDRLKTKLENDPRHGGKGQVKDGIIEGGDVIDFGGDKDAKEMVKDAKKELDGIRDQIKKVEDEIDRLDIIDSGQGSLFSVIPKPTGKRDKLVWRRDVVDQAKKTAKELGMEITLVNFETGLPKHIQKEIMDKGFHGQAAGVYDRLTGKVYIIIGNAHSAASVIETVVHEGVGHKGMIAALGTEKYNEVMDAIYNQMTPNERTEAAKGVKNKKDTRNIAEEYLANKANSTKRPNWLQKIIAQIRDWLRKKFKINYTENDIAYLFELSRQALKKNKPFVKGKGIRFNIIGPRGMTFEQLRNISVAEKMEKKGYSVDKIWQLTNLERGKDGEWRTETNYVTIKPEHKKEKTTIISLEELVGKDQELLKAYPQLKKTRVAVIVTEGATNTGSYDRPKGDNPGLIIVRAQDNYDAEYILTHEIQHAIQEIEGFAAGTNPKDVDTGPFKAMAISEANDLIDGLSKRLPKQRSEWNELHEVINERIEKLQDDIDTIKTGDMSVRAYEHDAGEVEARNASKRSEMTPEERKAQPLSSTEGIKRPRQIVSMYGGLSFSTGDDAGFRNKNKGVGDLTGFFGIELPEYIQLVKKLAGRYPQIKNYLGKGIGVFRHMEGVPESGKVLLRKALFDLKEGEDLQDIDLIEMVIAHETGHLIGSLPDGRLKLGNILGHISAAEKVYRKAILGKSPSHPEILTSKDRARLKKDAEKQLEEEWKQTAEEIIIEIIETEPIYSDIGLTPDDVLAIWRDVEARSKFPDIYEYVVRLSGAEKKKIMVKALKGIVDEVMAQKFAQRIVGEKEIRRTVTKAKAGDYVKDKDQVRKRYKELLVEEIRKREMFQKETIMDELKDLTKWWHPFNPLANAGYTKYRHSAVELYADAVSVLLNRPDELKKRAPEFFRAFFNWFDVREDAKNAFIELQQLANSGKILNTRKKNIQEGFKRGHEARTKFAMERSVQEKGWDVFLNAVVSRNIAMLNTIPSVITLGEELTERQKVRNTVEKMAYVKDMSTLLLKDITDNIVNTAAKSGIKLSDLGELAMYNRNINPTDRGAYANPLGLQATFAKAGIEELTRDYGDAQMDVMNDLLTKMHDIIWPYIKEAKESGLISQDVWDNKIVPNRDSYFTYAVVDYIENTKVRAITPSSKGTVSEIENPLYSTVAKVISFIQLTKRQESWNSVKKAMDQYRPGIIKSVVVKKGYVPRPTEKGNEVISVYENGKLVYYEAPDWVTTVFKYPALNKKVRFFMTYIIPFIPFKKFFNPAVTTYNPGWWMYSNVVRDNWRSVVNITTILSNYTDISPLRLTLMPFVDYTPAFFKGMVTGYKYVKGDWNDQIRSMLKEGTLFSDSFDRFDVKDGEDLLKPILVSLGMITKESRLKAKINGWDNKAATVLYDGLFQMVKYSGVPYTLRRIKDIGTIFEVMSKFAGQSVLSKYFGKDAATFFTRNYVSTPNGRDKAEFTTVIDNTVPFYNMITQSLRTGAELAVDRKTSRTYWTLQAMTAMLPAMAIGLMSSLMYLLREMYTEEEVENNPMLKRAYDYSKQYNKISDYDKLNYWCVITGETEEGDPTYLRLQLGEEQKIFFALFQWTTRSILQKELKGYDKLVNLGVGLTPSISPLLELGSGWKTYGLDNKSPIDSYYGSKVIPDLQMDAGIKESIPYMLKWTMNKSGLRPVVKMTWDKGLKGQTEEYRVNNIPYLSRLMKVGGAGERETAEYIATQITKNEANSKIWLQEKAKEAVSNLKEQNSIDDIGVRKEMAIEIAIAYMDKFGADVLDKQRAQQLVNTYMDLSTDDKYHNIITSLVFRNNNESVGILLHNRKYASKAESDALIDYMLERGIISKDLLRKFLIAEDEIYSPKGDKELPDRMPPLNDNPDVPKFNQNDEVPEWKKKE